MQSTAGMRWHRSELPVSAGSCALLTVAIAISVERAELPVAGFAPEDPRKAKLVELKFFGGLSMEDIATTLVTASCSISWISRDSCHRALGG